MTTIYPSAGQAPIADPAVHVLAIGVGHYPHLLDGDGAPAEKSLGLGQLDSPPLSAKAFVEWFLKRQGNCAVPLGTIEALISATAPMSLGLPGSELAVEGATRANVQRAFNAWLARVATHRENLGVLYFCGHGVMVADHYLLLEDFGADAGLPWANAFNVTVTLRAVEQKVRGSLYVFLDACRAVATDIALTYGANPPPLLAPTITDEVLRRSTCVIRATGEGQLAFGDNGQVSRYTTALVDALSGYCGVQPPGIETWNVDGEVLGHAVRKLLERGWPAVSDGTEQVSEQVVSGTPEPLLCLSQPPQVHVRLDLAPTEMRQVSKMYMLSLQGDAPREHDGHKGAYVADVPGGVYMVGARALDNQFVEYRITQTVAPPWYPLTMKAQQP
jgi:hypothetical protein